MPNVAQGDVYKFTLHQKLFEQQVVNTFAFRISALAQPIDEVNFLNGLFNGPTALMNSRIKENMRTVQSNALTYHGWSAQKAAPVQGGVFYFGNTGNSEGLLESEVSAANTAASVRRYGSGAGRNQRGRIAVAGLPDSLIANGRVGVIGQTGLALVGQGITGGYDAPLGAYTLQFGFWKALGIQPLPPAPAIGAFVHCVGYQVMLTSRVQRSRTVRELG